MNDQDFSTWCTDFEARFPSLAEWFLDPDRRETRRVWFNDLFSKYTLEVAVTASQELQREGAFPKGKFESDRMFRVYLKRLSELEYRERLSAQHDETKEPRYLCRYCQDTGFLRFNDDPVQYAHCGACEKSKDRQPYRSGRVLPTHNPNLRNPEDNEFNKLL